MERKTVILEALRAGRNAKARRLDLILANAPTERAYKRVRKEWSDEVASLRFAIGALEDEIERLEQPEPRPQTLDALLGEF